MPHKHRRPRKKLAALAAATALLATGGALGTSTAQGAQGASAAPPAAARAAEGPRVVGEKWLDARTVDLTVASPAVGKQLPVRVILPARFEEQPDRTWPVLYLLQGAHDDYTSWTRETDVEEFLADKDVITVMPSSGPTGIPTDWWNHGSPTAPDYEAFQVQELPALLRDAYRANGNRSVAGVSTGGYGAMAFAARHPGTFGAAASYSGVVDTTALGMPTVMNAIVARELLLPTALWGSPLLHRANWNSHNPAALAERLAGTRLYVSQGSGIPSSDFGNLEGAVLEGTLWNQARAFDRKLDRAGIPATVHFYSGGTHAWSSWQREFKASWPTLAAGLGLPSGVS
ncbi:alpha/beta hydrolase [Streptomyces longisporoflavus]|uniref:alpha/beta hydrolase n=1 Tax=Streptomyces longisporoflavus TaxID=28044 RepID=UPI00167D85CC|nr:alpha/beta hydrolase family protein [Streptomyces longisporoflavus]